MKKHLWIFALSLTFSILFPASVAAANTQGYAWSESVGWFDFSNVNVGNTAITGHAYNDNTGWLVLEGVTNTSGSLGGYAWSESVGYIAFTGVRIINGVFQGQAYNDNIGWLSFGTSTTVTTSWIVPTTPSMPVVSSVSYGGGGGYSSVPASPAATTTSSGTSSLHMQPGGTAGKIVSTLANINRNLKILMRGEDVRLLQQFLNAQGFIVAKRGMGSVGKESTVFGPATKQALMRFQIKNKITPAAGYFGPKTKAFIKTLPTNN